MPDVDLPAWLGWLIVTGIAATALLGIVRFVVRTGAGMKIVGLWIVDRVKDGVGQVVDDRLDQIREQLTINAGTSMKDQLARVENKLDQHVAWSEIRDREVAEALEAVESELADP